MKINALLYSDGSERSLSAAIYAAALMKGNPEMKLTIISFADYFKGTFGLVWDGAMIDTAILDNINREVLEKTKNIFGEHQTRVETAVVYGAGAIPDKIVQYAREGNFNLIIMGTKGPSDLKAAVVGSLAHNVVHQADCPVLLVKKLPKKILDALDD